MGTRQSPAVPEAVVGGAPAPPAGMWAAWGAGGPALRAGARAASGGAGQRAPELKGKTLVVVGGCGPVGQGLAAGLLEGGATVVVPSRSAEKLAELRANLGHPAGLATLHGGFGEEGPPEGRPIADQILQEFGRVDGVVAHGGLIRSDTLGARVAGLPILEIPGESILEDVNQLLGLHLRAAQALLPLMAQVAKQEPGAAPGYTLVTSGLDGPDGEAQVQAEGPAMTALYGLGLALRNSAAALHHPVRVNEVRVAMQINRTDSERLAQPRVRPLSLDLGRLAGYLAEWGPHAVQGLRVRARSSPELEVLLKHFASVQQ